MMSMVHVLNMGLEQKQGRLFMEVWVRNVKVSALEEKGLKQKIHDLLTQLPLIAEVETIVWLKQKGVARIWLAIKTPCLKQDETVTLCQEIQAIFTECLP